MPEKLNESERFYELNNTAEQIDNILTDINNVMENEVYDAPVVLKKGRSGERDFLTADNSLIKKVAAEENYILIGDGDSWIKESSFSVGEILNTESKSTKNEFFISNNTNDNVNYSLTAIGKNIEIVNTENDKKKLQADYLFTIGDTATANFSGSSTFNIKDQSNVLVEKNNDIHIGEYQNLNDYEVLNNNIKIFNGSSLEIIGRYNDLDKKEEKPAFRIHGQMSVDIDNGYMPSSDQNKNPIYSKATTYSFDYGKKKEKILIHDNGPTIRIHDNPLLEIDHNFYLVGHDDARAMFEGASSFEMKDTASAIFENTANFCMQAQKIEDADFNYGSPIFCMNGNSNITSNSGDYWFGPRLILDQKQLFFSNLGQEQGVEDGALDFKTIETCYKLKKLLKSKNGNPVLTPGDETDDMIINLIDGLSMNFCIGEKNPPLSSIKKTEKSIKEASKEKIKDIFCFLYEKFEELEQEENYTDALEIFNCIKRFLQIFEIKINKLEDKTSSDWNDVWSQDLPQDFFNKSSKYIITHTISKDCFQHILFPEEFYNIVKYLYAKKGMFFTPDYIHSDDLTTFLNKLKNLIQRYDIEQEFDVSEFYRIFNDTENITYFTNPFSEITNNTTLLNRIYQNFPYPASEEDSVYETYQNNRVFYYEVNGYTLLRPNDLRDTAPSSSYSANGSYLYKMLNERIPNFYVFQGCTTSVIGGGEGLTKVDIKSGRSSDNIVDVSIIDNAKVEVKNDATCIMRGHYDSNAKYFDRPNDGPLFMMHNQPTFLMYETTSQIPNNYTEKRGSSPLFIMTDKSEFKLKDGAFIKAERNPNSNLIEYTIGDEADPNQQVSFTVNDIKQLLALLNP